MEWSDVFVGTGCGDSERLHHGKFRNPKRLFGQRGSAQDLKTITGGAWRSKATWTERYGASLKGRNHAQRKDHHPQREKIDEEQRSK